MSVQFSEQEHGFQAIRFDGRRLQLLDQRRLPAEELWLEVDSADEAARAIADLVVRGAPAIGITAAYAAVLAARQRGADQAGWQADMSRLEQARPTAVNLSWAVNRMRRQVAEAGCLDPEALAELAVTIHREDVAANRRMAALGSEVIEPGSGVLTHCNTGSLATGGIGTALGVIVAGVREGRIARVFADETRPWLQGSRLTAWELARAGVDARILVEGAAGALMASGQVQWVITGADRITARGDVANKIGTYNLAILARHHGLRFMVVAPASTLDPDLESGQDIAIEQRDPAEIWRAAGLESAPHGSGAWNPVFDITPGELVDVIVTEHGVFRPPFRFDQDQAA
ncbi:MAG: S-methyl-5-thioribose-1-phosphate isomerase [Wenzhouxiangella sp.]|nr:S-methyl-5-thioribose-1-phosphate isomerase [Wenzhouxiangella sp.]MCH8477818.1 S-methyl-5-thioribose-1-phosphate isomerase [Wenzhouxiangella sp.]TVR93069.1 MAG: S-methyl-5-thioribose-1-phosphate isomerase [Wenzhouxiangellaceae bacterium]